MRLSTIIIGLFIIFWTAWLLIEYWIFHPYVSTAIFQMPYAGLITGLTGIGLASIWWTNRQLKHDQQSSISVTYRGIYVFLFIQLISGFILLSYVSQNNLPFVKPLIRLTYNFTYSSLLLGETILLTSVLWALGKKLLSVFEKSLGKNFNLISTAFGVSVFGFGSVVLGLLGLLNAVVVWGFILLIGVWRHSDIWHLLKRLLWSKQQWDITKNWQPFIVLILFVFVSINLLGSIKAYPNGYDGAGLYLNTVQLIIDNHTLPAGGQAFNWSVIISLGGILYGSISNSIFIAHLSGLLAFWALYRLGRTFISSPYSLLMVSVGFGLPFVAYHHFIDEKVDLGLLFISISSLIVLFTWPSKINSKKVMIKGLPLSSIQYKWILAGWLAGFGFGIKYTALFLLLGILSILFYQFARKWAYFGFIFLSIGILFEAGIQQFGYMDIRFGPARWTGLVLIIIGIFQLYRAFTFEKGTFKKVIINSVFVCTAFFINYLPWTIKHLKEHKVFSVSNLLQGKSSAPTINLPEERLGIITNPNSQQNGNAKLISFEDQPSASSQYNNNKQSSKINQGRREEIRRYMGYESGLWLYSSLPFDVIIGYNLPNSRYVDIGFLFLLIIPVLLISFKKTLSSFSKNLFLLIAGIILSGTTYRCVYGGLEYSESNVDTYRSQLLNLHPEMISEFLGMVHEKFSILPNHLATLFANFHQWGTSVSIPVTIAILMLSIYSFYLLFSERLSQLSVSLKSMLGFVFTWFFLWLLFGNGITWYALPVLMVFLLFIGYLLENSDKLFDPSMNKFIKPWLSTIIVIQLIINVVIYFTNPQPIGKTAALFPWPFIEYASNPKFNKTRVLASFNAYYPKTVSILNEDDDARIYRVGTFLNFHITNNDKRVYEDNTLTKFAEISKFMGSKDSFIDVLRNNGFSYILYDLNTPTLDKTPEKSLVAKTQQLIELLVFSDQLQLVCTDNILKPVNGETFTSPTGVKVNGIPGLGYVDQVLVPGTFALYKIK